MNASGCIKLSVIIPTKSRPQLLKRSLMSVASQNYSGFEVCVVDNNTDANINDHTKVTVSDFEEQYPHIRWLYLHSAKHFASGARNDGMAVTTGEYIVFLDDDDELLKDSIKIRADLMAADTDIALLYCAGYSKIHPYPFKMYRYYHYDRKRHKDKLMMMSCSSIMINRSIFERHGLNFDEQLSRMDDYDLCRRVIQLNMKVKSTPAPLVLINIHPETRISSCKLLNYDFKNVLISRWRESATDAVYNYAEGVHIWRKCFGIQDLTLAEITASLKRDFNRKPTLSFRIKYLLVSIHPTFFLLAYHAAIFFSQQYKNTFAGRLKAQ